MLKVGAIGFGGGSALIPVMERELVGRRGGLSELVFVQHTVIANITPGALPVKLAALSGVQVGGAATGLVSALLVALPGTALTVGLLASFAALGPGAIGLVEHASLGVTAFILYLLAHYVAKVMRSAGHRRWAYGVIAVLACAATGTEPVLELCMEIVGTETDLAVPQLSALGLILVSLSGIGAFSLVQVLRGGRVRARERAEGGVSPRRVLSAAALGGLLVMLGFLAAAAIADGKSAPAFLGLVTFSTVSSFGGGEAYVGVADGLFVQADWVSSEFFYTQIVPLANALPGPILIKIAAGIAYGSGLAAGGPALGAILAVAAYLASVGTCCIVALSVLAGYDRVRDARLVSNIAGYILPVICGLLASTAVSMLHASARVAGDTGVPPLATVGASIAVAVAVALIQRRAHVSDVIVIGACAALSLSILSSLRMLT